MGVPVACDQFVAEPYSLLRCDERFLLATHVAQAARQVGNEPRQARKVGAAIASDQSTAVENGAKQRGRFGVDLCGIVAGWPCTTRLAGPTPTPGGPTRE